MAKRIRMVVTPEVSGACNSAARDAAELARESGGMLRIMHVSPVPPPRLDRHGRVVADADREMAHIAARAEARLSALAAQIDDVPVERVVRFGRLVEEVSFEAEAFGADLVALASFSRPRLRDHFLARYLARIAFGSATRVAVLPLGPTGVADRMRDALAIAALRQT